MKAMLERSAGTDLYRRFNKAFAFQEGIAFDHRYAFPGRRGEDHAASVPAKDRKGHNCYDYWKTKDLQPAHGGKDK